ncbi:hypothetical protein P43SY_004026 [Pythium insidiosum]|uniref:Protein phosphatase inhibitor 2 n=1 Tax=Pythium insidiosum TaxID=114742 RepID=A0AAD5LXY3_PYTIN|nr:hypothetical protein P43SY_004026 [Pythium insidiosum]
MEAERPHVTWDEETIALHDAERGTRMKIEEPKTPYHYYRSDHDDGAGEGEGRSSLALQDGAPSIEWKELQVKLEDVQARKRSDWDSSDDEDFRGARFAARDDEGKKIVKDPKFAEKRKMHYNEFERLRQWRQQHAKEEEDDDDEEEEEDEGREEGPKSKMAKRNSADAADAE